MPNPHRGEVALSVGGDTHMLRLNTNTICNLESELDMSVDEITTRFARGYLTVLRSALRAALNYEITLERAGEMVDEAGPRVVLERMMEAFRLAFPDPEADTARPPSGAAAGTGQSSSPIGSPPASPSPSSGASRPEKSKDTSPATAAA